MGDDAVVDVDREIVGGVAAAALGDELQVPRAVIGRSRIGVSCQGEYAGDRNGAKSEPFHDRLSNIIYVKLR
jgi:hypothetical protein